MVAIHTANILLGLVTVNPSHGYEIKRSYDELFGESKTILFGQVYSTMSRLKRDGLVIELDPENEINSTRDARQKRYQATVTGRQKFYEWMQSPEESSPNLQFNLFVKAIFNIILEGDANEFVLSQKSAHIKKMHEYVELRRKATIANQIASSLLYDHAILQLDAQIKWMELVIEKIKLLKEEVNGTTK